MPPNPLPDDVMMIALPIAVVLAAVVVPAIVATRCCRRAVRPGRRTWIMMLLTGVLLMAGVLGVHIANGLIGHARREAYVQDQGLKRVGENGEYDVYIGPPDASGHGLQAQLRRPVVWRAMYPIVGAVALVAAAFVLFLPTRVLGKGDQADAPEPEKGEL